TARRPPDLNQLIGIYRQWLRLFPFDVSYLSHLREHFQRKLPILRKDTLATNIYTGISSFKVITKEELINHLTETTREIIEKVNALESFKKGTLGDKTQTAIELLDASQAVKLESLRLK